MRVAQVKADIIRQREIELLQPAAGPGASEVLRLLSPVSETGVLLGVPAAANNAEPGSVTAPVASGEAAISSTTSELVGLSCVIGSNGEVCNIKA
jgi:hypothetical protein